MSSQSDLGKLDAVGGTASLRLEAVRWLLPIGWVLSGVGFLGPWIAHPTAALSLSGVDMAEFVKFLPGALDGSLTLVRQVFYLPPFAVTASLALLIHSESLRYHRLLRALGLLLAVPLSLQLLPPAWSPSSLLTAEFRAQTIALVICWLLLTGSWLLRRLPTWLSGTVSAALCLVALLLTTWQFLLAKPATDEVYSTIPAGGWGIWLCLVGLAIATVASMYLVLTGRRQSRSPLAKPLS
ncbi:MAG: hypothetical protein PVI67_13030 [Anaerolineae bacterium]